MKSRRFALLVFAVCSALAASTVQAQAAPPEKKTYIVKITPGSAANVEKSIKAGGGSVKRQYANVFEGFMLDLPEAAAKGLANNPNVEIMEEDQDVDPLDWQSPTPSWGLDRIDQRTKVSGTSSFGYVSAGTGATVYVVDTGVYAHTDLQGRLSTTGFTSINDGNGTVDCNGHGTHVAGTIAGTQYGIAKNAKVVPVRVLDCSGSGTMAGVIAGLDWILSAGNTNAKTQAVVNMSLGGGASTTLDAAVNKLTNSGIVVAVAAGNENTDACTRSPARAASAITVGATDYSDVRASFSNYGSCVDINAPGVSITSSWIGSATATRTISGTSMATPHVAGAVAVYMGLNPTASVAQVTQAIKTDATPNVITGLPAGTVNSMLYVSPTDGAPLVVAPTVALRTVTNITYQSATISYDVNPGNAETSVAIEYSTASDMSGKLSVPANPSKVSGTDLVTVSADLTSLKASATYYFRAVATNSTGTSNSPVGTFQTLAIPKTKATPKVRGASNVTAYSATLSGSVIPGNDLTQVQFVYGTDPNFQTNTTTVAVANVSGTSETAVTTNITFLNGGSVYYVKVVATNSSGVVESDAYSFTTPTSLGKPALVTTKKVTGGMRYESQTLGATVNPQGQTTTVTLVYGPSSALTSFSGARTVQVANGPFTGEANIDVSVTLTNFGTPGAITYYRFDATNASGVTKGAVEYGIVAPLEHKILSTRVDNSRAYELTFSAKINAGGSNTRWTVIYGTSPTLINGDGNGFTLAPGAKEVSMSPWAVTSAYDVTGSARVIGLENNTTYYYLVRGFSYTGPLAGKSIFLGGSTSTINFVPKGQIIDFPAIPDRQIGPAAPLYARATSGLSVSYTSLTPSVCAVLYSGYQYVVQSVGSLTGQGPWTCTVRASQPGNTYYLAATPVERTFNWLPTNMMIAPLSSTSMVVGTNIINSALRTVTSSLMSGLSGLALPITVTSNTPTVCRVDSTVLWSVSGGVWNRSTVTGLTAGTCQLKFDFPGSDRRTPATLTWNATVK